VLERVPARNQLRRRDSENDATRRRAADEALGREILARQAEAHRRLPAARYVGADGQEIPLATLLVEAAVAGELAEWAGYRLGLGRS
jgi:hypothetical protein